jgi:hypothetical protein
VILRRKDTYIHTYIHTYINEIIICKFQPPKGPPFDDNIKISAIKTPRHKSDVSVASHGNRCPDELVVSLIIISSETQDISKIKISIKTIISLLKIAMCACVKIIICT